MDHPAGRLPASGQADPAGRLPASGQADLVTIVIVCHNDWPDLELAIESALHQSHPHREIIVVDNDSGDETRSQIENRYCDRIRYLRQPNLGAAGGRNAGMALARGRFIQLLDGDDMLAPNKIAKQAEFLAARPEIDIVYGRFRSFRSTPEVAASALVDSDPPACDDIRRLLLTGCPGPPTVFMFRREVAERIGPQDAGIYNEDYDWWLRAAFAGCRFAATPDAWSFYRRRKGQKSENRLKLAHADRIVLTRALDYVVEEPYRSYLRERLARLLHGFAHYYLLIGDRRRARGYLRRATKMRPANCAAGWPVAADWLARLPAGPALYGLIRKARKLRPPFSSLAAPTDAPR